MDRIDLAASQWRREMPSLELLPMEVVGRLGQAARLITRTHL